MPLLDLDKITTGLSRTWTALLGDWDRSLRAGNYPETTRYIYLLAAGQLARYLGEYLPDPEAVAAAEDPSRGESGACGVVSGVDDPDPFGGHGVEQAQGVAAVFPVASRR